MGGGMAEKVMRVIKNGYPCVPVTYDDGDIHHIYQKYSGEELTGYVNFYRIDHYRIVSYFYMK